MRAISLLPWVSLAVACNAVLGYEAAHLDPTLVDAGDPNSCNAYCTNIMKNCKGAFQEYTSENVCLSMCSFFEPGVPGTRSGNSRACRIVHASEAATAPNLHCRSAGPLGGGECGDPYDSFCLLNVALCKSPNPVAYTDDATCAKTARANFDYLKDDKTGDLSTESGNTLNCRYYHLDAAYERTNAVAASTHCPHTAVVSSVCH